MLSSCLPRPNIDSQPKLLVEPDLSREKVAQAIKASDYTLLVNQTTNRLTYYVGGKPVDQWNIASADITGQSHKVNEVPEKQTTPTGIFTAHDIQHCPSWYPRKPFNPKTGKITTDPEERKTIFEENRDLYGPCGKTNPLGKFALWFDGTYGVHGNASEWILDLEVEDRRVSGGCIRNPNHKIQKVFTDIINRLPEFKTKFAENINKPNDQRKTLTAYAIPEKVLVYIIVGNWDSDPVHEGQKTVKRKMEISKKSDFVKTCTVQFVNPKTNMLEIFAKNPLEDVIGTLAKGTTVNVIESDGPIDRIKAGYVNGNYLGNCRHHDPLFESKVVDYPADTWRKEAIDPELPE